MARRKVTKSEISPKEPVIDELSPEELSFFDPLSAPAPSGARGFVFELPEGHIIPLANEEEMDFVGRLVAPYLSSKEQIPSDYWPLIRILIQNHVEHDRLSNACVPSLLEAAPDSYSELVKRKESLQKLIKDLSAKLDPLKFKRHVDEANLSQFIDKKQQEALDYAMEHRGEYTWRCPSCGGLNLMEVPHFAYDLAGGTSCIYNKQVFDLVNIYYRKAKSPSYDGGLSVKDAAKILGVSPIDILFTAYEREIDLGFDYNLNKPETLRPYVV